MTDMHEDDDSIDGPYWCTWCEAVIVIDGEFATEEAEAYWHAYDHMAKGPTAVEVMDGFEHLDVVETEQHKMEPPGGE